MFWPNSHRKGIADAKRRMRQNMSVSAARAFGNASDMTADAEAKARDLSLAAIDQLFARLDDLGDALAAVSQDAASLARTRTDRVLVHLVDELKEHPVRSLAIAVGIGMTAGLYARR
jgi:ElaB/YqjD/DUF883 family membrane-anchored ribosome-binding protein